MPAAYRNFCMGPDGRLRAPDKKTRVQRPVCGADIDSAAVAGDFVLLALVPSAFRTRNNSSHNS